jgi:hypothetical protein
VTVMLSIKALTVPVLSYWLEIVVSRALCTLLASKKSAQGTNSVTSLTRCCACVVSASSCKDDFFFRGVPWQCSGCHWQWRLSGPTRRVQCASERASPFLGRFAPTKGEQISAGIIVARSGGQSIPKLPVV